MLSNIKMPDFNKRPPRRISDKGHWKGRCFSYCFWVLGWKYVYSFLCSHRASKLVLVLFCPNFRWYPTTALLIFIHCCKLIQGVYILLGSHITPGLLNVAESSLKDFYKDMEEFYCMIM